MLNPILKKEYDAKWVAMDRKRNPERYRIKQAAQNERLRAKVLLLYGSQCEKCGFNDSRALQLDHKSRPIGAYSTKHHLHAHTLCRAILSGKENWLDYQLLCANCNWIKRHTNREYGLLCGEYQKQVGLETQSLTN